MQIVKYEGIYSQLQATERDLVVATSYFYDKEK